MRGCPLRKGGEMDGKELVDRRSFINGTVQTAALGAVAGTLPGKALAQPERGIKVLFLGSGAAGWRPEWAKNNPHMRRQSSVLLDRKVIIDFTKCSFDLLPKDCRPEAIFITHSHGDHYNPAAVVKSAVRRVYVQESWAASARKEITAVAAKLSLPAPEVVALRFGETVEESGLRITGVPAIHSTSWVTDGILEQASMYLVEKGEARLLYATDTGGISGDAARIIGIDPHVTEKNFSRYPPSKFVSRPKALTAFIMEATNADLDEDFRLFVHSSVQAVSRIVNMLKANGRFAPPPGQKAYLTHFGLKYRAWPSEKIEAELPPTLAAAYDGLEVTLG